MQTKNIRRFGYATLCAMLTLLMSVTFVACDDDDDSNSGFRLESFGPSPAMRGGELIFIGRQLNTVQSVEFANGIKVADLNFESDEKFRITIPKEAEPGYLTLHTASGDVVTKTQVGFTEPITFGSFSKVEVLPGEEITINGEYLMSVVSVEFPTGNVVDTPFVAQTKDLIKLVVPMAAKTGKLCLTDGSNMVYTSAELIVTLPVCKSISKTENVYPGVDEITLTGTNLNLVERILFAGDQEVLTSDEAVRVSATEITLKVPAKAQSGEVKMYPLSEVECTAGSIAVVGPNVNKFAEIGADGFFVAPADPWSPSADSYFLGSKYTMTGTNLDLIESVSCGSGSTSDFTLNADNTELTFEIPATATCTNWSNSFGCAGQMYSGWQSGFIVSVTSKQGASTEVGVLFALWGEQMWSATQTEIGGDVYINGPNPRMCDFIQTLTLDGLEVQFNKNSDGSITVPAVDARHSLNPSFACVFTNGVKGGCSGATMAVPEYNFITAIPSDLVAGKLIEINGANFSAETRLYFGSIEVTDMAVKDESTVYCTLPAELSGEYSVKVVDGKGTYTWPEPVEVVGSLLVVYDGNGDISWNKDKGGTVDITTVSKINIYVTWTGPGDGWIGLLAQNMAGKNLWAAQKDISGYADFDINSGSYKLVVPASEFDMSAEGTIDNTDWYICGGANAEGVKIEKITAEF